ncbi:MAG: hypothetical protein O3A01_02985 [bacterium]|nr:hypothetical protein [bacterium]
MTQSHLFIVVFRAYFNKTIFKAYRRRLIFIPILVLAGCMLSKWFLVSLLVLNTWWDVYHSSLQTFGIGRLYDREYGNPKELGRRWDFGLALVSYFGVLLAGVMFMDHVSKFANFHAVGSVFFTNIPYFVSGKLGIISRISSLVILAYIVAYVLRYAGYIKQGYVVPWQKVLLFSLTALVSVLAWGFNTFGMAYIIMNFFHAWQYFGIMIWAEKRHMTELFHFQKFSYGQYMAIGVFLLIALLFGLWVLYVVPPYSAGRLGISILATIATMHFWFDGFIWSVRKGDI